ncbi:GTP-binding protein RAD [Bacillus rossius redtenbacheri]|uniref:GTP-binding protein RAD n=1 Tax=Bacillus rossius redtenbacheri TaxID=93214 RepID=UPI002FDE503A
MASQDGTPGARRRRPAARSQSARTPGGGRRRTAAAAGGGMRAGTSEPRLCDLPAVVTASTPEASPAERRRQGSTRRSTRAGGQQRKSTAFLEVPDRGERLEDEDDESYRLRSFSFTSKGVVNRGDSFRRRRSRSNSLVPPGLQSASPDGGGGGGGGCATPAPAQDDAGRRDAQVITYRVAMIGASGVGKTALVSQFMTSECINAYDRQRDVPREQSVSIMLNGEESELSFINIANSKVELDRQDPPDAFVVMYSVIDKASFQRAEDELARLQDWGLLRTRPAILVGNKVDLARSRAISTQDGKCLACTYRAKFIEISVGINHNIDELLVGILNQIRLKLANAEHDSSVHWYKSRGVVRASMKARQMFTWVFGKEDSKFKNCENLHVL